MPQRAIKYAVVDAFTSEAFKGNPAAVCLLEENAEVDKKWMLSVAKEFNTPITAFLSRHVSDAHDDDAPWFRIWWSTPAVEIELSSGKEVAMLQPNFEEIKKCEERAVIVTGPAPAGSEFDFFTRVFCPKFGFDEDHVCGSVHCALAPLWNKKLNKQSFTSFMASPRSGVLYVELEEKFQRVRIRGEAVTVMLGTLLV
ncbi:isomerase BNA [Carex littledalei]|uniref:Isomerase BNA n=1 Tax=Carex littledalei TaxID=544730 RepID=A0A833VBT0_9POAL|nr:isomerase BNA [Carex littledalei]